MASTRLRASTLPDWSSTAVGTCLTSVLIAQPNMKSNATGTTRVSASASQSLRRWMNSFTTMPTSLEDILGILKCAQLLAQPGFSFAVYERDEQVLHRGLYLVGRADRNASA